MSRAADLAEELRTNAEELQIIRKGFPLISGLLSMASTLCDAADELERLDKIKRIYERVSQPVWPAVVD